MVLEHLDRVTAEQADEKLRNARALRGAFVFRHRSSPEAPAAGEYVFSEACRRAKAMRSKMRRGAPLYPPPREELAGGMHEVCTIRWWRAGCRASQRLTALRRWCGHACARDAEQAVVCALPRQRPAAFVCVRDCDAVAEEAARRNRHATNSAVSRGGVSSAVPTAVDVPRRPRGCLYAGAWGDQSAVHLQSPPCRMPPSELIYQHATSSACGSARFFGFFSRTLTAHRTTARARPGLTKL